MGRSLKWTDEKIEEEAEYLLEWANLPGSLVLGMCYGSRGYTYQDAKEWAQRNDKYREAKLLAFTLVGSRREMGGLINKLSSGLVSRTMPLYDPDYNDLVMQMKKAQDDSELKEHSDLCAAIQSLMKDQTIVCTHVAEAS